MLTSGQLNARFSLNLVSNMLIYLFLLLFYSNAVLQSWICAIPRNRTYKFGDDWQFSFFVHFQDSIANFRNLAGAKSHHTNGTHESASLLDTHPQNKLRGICIQSGGQPHQTTTTMASHLSGDGSLGGPAPRKRRFEQFLKSLVGRRPSKEQPLVTNPPTPPPPLLLPSPELKVTKSPSVHSLSDFNKTAKLNSSTTSLNSVHQKLWSVVPLLKRDTSSCSNSQLHTTKSSNHLAPPKVPFLRKCETVLALSDSQGHQPDEPIRPLNRLRNCASVATCSRCSSLLSLAADGSKYSLNASTGGFVTVDQRNSQPTSGSSSDSLQKLTEATVEASHTPPPAVVQTNVRITTPTITVLPPTKFTCKLCLGEYSADSSTKIQQCGCSFCTEVSEKHKQARRRQPLSFLL
jgi:E3 ubiquitin-protein ligase RNF144